MSFIRFLILVLVPVSSLFSIPAYITFPSDVPWVTKNSEHFEIMYRKGQGAFAERTLRAAERAHQLLTPIFPQHPKKTWIVLADFQDSLNGYALNFPYSHIVIFAAPPEAAGQLSTLDDWLDSVVLHEYVHILHLYPANGLWKALRFVFGSIIVPNGLMPSHFHEGLATLLETEMTKGGRGRGSHFSMYRRMAVNEKVWGSSEFSSLDRMDGTLSLWPHGIAPYFFGYTLYQELWDRKKAKGISDLTLSHSSNWPYLLHIPLKQIYGVDYAAIWKEIFAKTEKSAHEEIDAIKKSGISTIQYLTHSRFHKGDVALDSSGKRVAYRQASPSTEPAIEIRHTETAALEKRIQLSGSPAEGLCWWKWDQKEVLLFLQSFAERQYSIKGLSIYQLDAERADRVGALGHLHRLSCTPSHDKILVYREEGGAGSVIELKVITENGKPSVKRLRKWQIPEGTWVTSLLVGSTSWFMLREGLNTHLYRWNSEGQPVRVLTLKGHVFNLRPKAPGQLLAIANFDGREEIWSIDAERKQRKKWVALLGGANSFDVRDEEIIVSSYEHGGYDIAKVTPIASVEAAVAEPAAATNTGSNSTATSISEEKSYSAWGTLYPRTWVPSVFFVPDGVQIGAWIPGFDVSQRHLYDLFAGWDTRGLGFADLSYVYRFGQSSLLNFNAFFVPSYLQLFKEFFKKWGGSIGIGGQLGSFPPFFTLNVLYKRIEASSLEPANQSVGFEAGVSHRMGYRQRPLSISPIRGTKLSLSHAQFLKALGSDDNYFSSVAGVAQYLEAPWWKEHVWYLALKAGYTEGTTFFNSYFEGGGELLFYQSRGVFLNRGFLPGLFPARRILNLNVEYRFPIAVIERGIGLMPVQLKAIHAAFVWDTTTFDRGDLHPRDVILASNKNLFKRFFTSVGVELKTNWHFFFYLPAEVRVGAYHGFGRFGESLYVTVGAQASL